MNDLKHIALNEYEQVPPENVWLGLCSALDQIEASEKKFQEVGNYEVLPDPAIWLAISKSLEIDKLPDVTDHAKASPVSINGGKQKATATFSLPRAIVYIAIAASLVVGFFTVYQATQQKNNAPIIASNQKTNPSTQPAAPQPAPALPDTTTIAAAEKEKPTTHTNKRLPAKKTVKEGMKEGFVSNNIFEIEDEDSFFLTLANYVLPANNKNNGRISIKVDQYSSLYISTKMSLFMQGLYERSGKKNKPTRKARRNYRALRSWKKACNKTFGEARMQDVSNPFVLAEFLYKNR